VGESRPQFALHTSVPNPFNPSTLIRYEVVPGGADVNITVFDAAGRRVRTLVSEHRAAGSWSVSWNGTDDRGARVSSGVYFYRMHAGAFVDTKKMVLLK
jgi:flagellar hook assembly protein FlgD